MDYYAIEIIMFECKMVAEDCITSIFIPELIFQEETLFLLEGRCVEVLREISNGDIACRHAK